MRPWHGSYSVPSSLPQTRGTPPTWRTLPSAVNEIQSFSLIGSSVALVGSRVRRPKGRALTCETPVGWSWRCGGGASLSVVAGPDRLTIDQINTVISPTLRRLCVPLTWPFPYPLIHTASPPFPPPLSLLWPSIPIPTRGLWQSPRETSIQSMIWSAAYRDV